MPVLDDLADVASSAGVGTVGTNLFKSTIPSTPDALVALFLTGGPASVHAMASAAGQAVADRPHIQALSRAARADDAYLTIQKLHNALNGIGGRTINGIRYYSVFALQQPFFLREDETGRKIYACNYEILKAPATSS